MVERGLELEEMAMEKEKEKEKKGLIRDESRLPRMVVRVLLVEADDCTRRIITALLRKCSYRVAAVGDGLKAWDMLKGRPHNVDLILTEVELPSISGYALLTLIMEHDVCKSIPVIMMSSKDSMSLVMKCMMKGAADFLIKPVRKNELKILWQHVWRRRLVQNVPKCKLMHGKDKAAFEVDGANDHSSNLTSPERNRRSHEKCSDSQSACGKPNLEAETAAIPNNLLKFCMKSENASTIADTGKNEQSSEMVDVVAVPKSDRSVGNDQYGEVASHHGSPMLAVTGVQDHARMESRVNIKSRTDNLGEQAEFTRAINCHESGHSQPACLAIDMIGKFEACTQDKDGHFQTTESPKKADGMPKLEMSLRSTDHSSTTDERPNHGTLHPSKASAFSRYDNSRLPRPPFSESARYPNQGVNSCHQQFANLPHPFHSSPGHSLAPSQENMRTVVLRQYGQPEEVFRGAYIGFVPIPDIRFDSAYPSYGNLHPPVYYMQPSFNPFWSKKPHSEEPSLLPSSSIHSCSEVSNPDPAFRPNYEQTHHSANRAIPTDDARLEMGETSRDGSPVLGLSNDFDSKVSSTVTGMLCRTSEGNLLPAASAAAARPTESVNHNCQLDYNGPQGKHSKCTSQREEALLKFRMKRKDRCYQKKVRYQSRKRLAEQRPRVKGQFVRNMPDVTSPHRLRSWPL